MPLETNSPTSATSGAVGNPGGSIQDAMQAPRNRLNSAYQSVQQRSSEMLEGACGYVEKHPLQAVIYSASIGAVVGLVAGLILGERSGSSWHKRWW